jgi:voltage-dependent potassium channel beta subunit
MSKRVTAAQAVAPSGEIVGEPTRRTAHNAWTSNGFLRVRLRCIICPLTLVFATRDSNRAPLPLPARFPSMNHRRLGRSGLKVSELSFGSWITYGNQLGSDTARECMAAAYAAGVNFFDNAEVYAKGEAERLMGEALRRLGWRRSSYVVSTKFFWGLYEGPNEKQTLNRKYLRQAIDASLARLQLDYVDLVYCHRADPHTPIDETVYAMHDMVAQGKALYWGTSEWTADEIAQAWHIADQHHLHKPTMEQPQYNLLHRDRVEKEYARLYRDIGLGTTTWSPLASGLLTGKYNDGIPPGSRGTIKGYEWLAERLGDPARIAAARRLAPIASELGCTLGQLAIAWCLKNPNVSTVITGASRVDQVRENMKAVDVVERLDADAMARIDTAVAGR